MFDFLLSNRHEAVCGTELHADALASGNEDCLPLSRERDAAERLQQWAAFIRKLISHWVDRYGVGEVREWFFEVWNEPNLKAFWTGTQARLLQALSVTRAKRSKSVDASLRVGGPATAKNDWIDRVPRFL